MDDVKKRLFEIWFSLCCGAGNREFPQLLERFGTPYDLYNADDTVLEGLPCSPKLKSRLANKDLTQAQRIMDDCLQSDVGILFWLDENYPTSLRSLADPPVLLYYRGKLPDLSKRLCISVVGTRRMSEYGKGIAYKLGYELAAAGVVVVSGMARGIDGVAAVGALQAGGTTVAVLGSGIDVIYPPEHEPLYHEIMKTGLILSEYPPRTQPNKGTFPARNRIISGLSQGTVVVEGTLHSGSLITARTAIMQGRDIYAFPGNVGLSNSSGTNKLLSDGAAVVLRSRDVLENYLFLYKDVIRKDDFYRAETRSTPNEAELERMGVCARTAGPKTSPYSPQKGAYPADDRRREAPSSPPPTIAALPPKSVPAHGDDSNVALQSLTESQRRMFEALPLDHAVSIDYFTREGYTVEEILMTMTVLEFQGLVVILPGTLFSRK